MVELVFQPMEIPLLSSIGEPDKEYPMMESAPPLDSMSIKYGPFVPPLPLFWNMIPDPPVMTEEDPTYNETLTAEPVVVKIP